MSSKNLKWLAAASALSALGLGVASADMHMDNHGAMFTARGTQTSKITIGGQMQVGFNYIKGSKSSATSTNTAVNAKDEQYVNFLVNHLRLMTKAELPEDWSVVANIDFVTPGANERNSYNVALDEDTSGSGVKIDKAYIQKIFMDQTFRLGYQKVPFGLEETTPETDLLAIERSATTNFFTNLGSDFYSRTDENTNALIPERQDRGFAGRHIGLYMSGSFGDEHVFHYNVAIANGYRGLSFYSTKSSDSPSFWGGLEYSFMMNDIDFAVGMNLGIVPEGANGPKQQGNVWAINPYATVDYENFAMTLEFFYGGIEKGKRNVAAANLGKGGTAHPFGFQIMPSFTYEDCEFVGRFGYTDTGKFGTTVQNALGSPLANAVNGHWSHSNNLYNKFYHIYVGLNYYMLEKSVKASAGYEYLKFSSPITGLMDSTGKPHVHAFRTALQLVF